MLYYKSFRFFFIDSVFKIRYLFKNPYRLSKKEGFLYGETPLTTMDLICRECRILSKDIFYDLGCGRGRNLFWLSHFVQCQTIGIEISPHFVRWGKQMQFLCKMENFSLINQDMIDPNYENATVIYIYGTSFPDELVIKLINKLKKLRETTKIITVSFTLNEYEDAFEIKKTFRAKFPWGWADIFLQTPKPL